MKILVSDTNIFIDLYNCGLLDLLFRLPARIHTVDVVLEELKNPEQKAAVSRYQGTQDLYVKSLDGKEVQRVAEYMYKNAEHTNLTFEDCSVLCYTKQLNDARLLTGDQKLRHHAEKEGLLVSGILFLFDMFVEYKLLAELDAANGLQGLRESNPRLPQDAIEERINKWRKL